MKSFAERKWGSCKGAVAYCLHFTKMCYGYNSDCTNDYMKSNCDYCEHNKIQYREYEYPKIDFSKKDFARLDTCEPVVSERFMRDMIAFGISENCFKAVYNKKHSLIVGYQLTPADKLSDFAEINAYKVISECRHCGHKQYELDDELCFFDANKGFGYPLYINEKALSELENMAATVFSNDILISLEFYEYLLERYPKLECKPVFLGDVFHDNEYLRVHSTDEEKTDKMTSYSLLEHCSNRGDIKTLGVFKSEDISELVDEYSKQPGFNRAGGVFSAVKECYIDRKKQDFVYELYIWREGNYPPWDDELEEYDCDECVPDYHSIHANMATAQKRLNDYLDKLNLIEDDVVFEISRILTDIKYWYDGFETEYIY